MKLVVTVAYKDIYSDTPPTIENLLKDIPSRVLLAMLSAINAELYLDQNEESTQLKLLKLFTQRFSIADKSKIVKGIEKIQVCNERDQKSFPIFFTVKHTLEFIHHELNNFRELNEIKEDFTPEQELNIFKAYLIIAQQIGDKDEQLFLNEKVADKEDFFYIKTWPILIKQFGFAVPVDPFYQLIRGIVFLNYLHDQPEYKPFVDHFLATNNRFTTWQYLYDLIQFLTVSWQDKGKKEFKNFCITVDSNYRNLLEYFCIDLTNYKDEPKNQQDYIGIRTKPLFIYGENQYLVLNWNFFSSLLYDGLLYDFHRRSGIDQQKAFKQFVNLKSFVSHNISEQVLFRRILKSCLSKPYNILSFDEKIKRVCLIAIIE